MIKKALQFIFTAIAIITLLLLGVFFMLPYLIFDWVFDFNRPITRDEYYGRF